MLSLLSAPGFLAIPCAYELSDIVYKQRFLPLLNAIKCTWLAIARPLHDMAKDEICFDQFFSCYRAKAHSPAMLVAASLLHAKPTHHDLRVRQSHRAGRGIIYFH